MKKYETTDQRIADCIVPNLSDYKKVRNEENGCKGCDFFKMNVQCSKIPCQPSVARPYPVQYKKKS